MDFSSGLDGLAGLIVWVGIACVAIVMIAVIIALVQRLLYQGRTKRTPQGVTEHSGEGAR